MSSAQEPSPSGVGASLTHGHNPVHDLLALLKGAITAVLDFAPPLGDVSPPARSHHHHNLGPPDPDRSCVDIIRRLLGAGGATELRINAIPTRVLRVESGVVEDCLEYGQDTCSICLDGYECNNRVRILGCQHVYHSSCVESWLRRRPTCPMCQTVCC